MRISTLFQIHANGRRCNNLHTNYNNVTHKLSVLYFFFVWVHIECWHRTMTFGCIDNVAYSRWYHIVGRDIWHNLNLLFLKYGFLVGEAKGKNKWITNDLLDGLHANFIHFNRTFCIIFTMQINVNVMQAFENAHFQNNWKKRIEKRKKNNQEYRLEKFLLVFIASNTH